jgi:hypothetical protein
MSNYMALDDFKEGVFFTLLEQKVIPINSEDTLLLADTDIGVPYQFCRMEGPFILCRGFLLEENDLVARMNVFDTRSCKFMKISREYFELFWFGKIQGDAP